MTLGERIRERRIHKNMSLRELAEALGVSAPTVQRYENGTIRNIDSNTLTRLAEALDTSVSYLVGESENRPTGGASMELNPTEQLLVRIYRSFTPQEKNAVRSVIMTINSLRISNKLTLNLLEFAEEFIDSTEYSSEYQKEKAEKEENESNG